jgi:hypothetical protein
MNFWHVRKATYSFSRGEAVLISIHPAWGLRILDIAMA